MSEEMRTGGFEMSPEQDKMQGLLGDLMVARAGGDSKKAKMLQRLIAKLRKTEGSQKDAEGQKTVIIKGGKKG